MPFKMFILRERLRLLEKYRCQSCRSRKKAAQECKSDVCSAAGSGSSTNPRTTSIFGATTECARVAKLADAPNLGLRNHRFQSVAFHFKANAFYEWKTGFSYEIVAVANGEQNAPRSSTNSSTRTCQTSPHAILRLEGFISSGGARMGVKPNTRILACRGCQ